MEKHAFLSRYANQVVEECSSTNDVAKELGELRAPHGTWTSARKQNQGRGRLGRSWGSAEGNLAVSLVLRGIVMERWTLVPLVVALSVAEFLEKKGVPTQIKWPNDLLVHKKKVGGILCEGVCAGDDSYLVVGLGLNCESAPKNKDLAIPATALMKEKVREKTKEGVSLDESLSAEALLPLLIPALLEEIDGLKSESKQPYVWKDRYLRKAFFGPRDAISWRRADVDPRKEKTGTVLRYGDQGELWVLDDRGVETRLLSEEVSLSRANF